MALYAVVFNAGLNAGGIKHVFRGLSPNFARELLKAIRPCSEKIGQDPGRRTSQYQMTSEYITCGMQDLGIHGSCTHTPIHTHTHTHTHAHTHIHTHIQTYTYS